MELKQLLDIINVFTPISILSSSGEKIFDGKSFELYILLDDKVYQKVLKDKILQVFLFENKITIYIYSTIEELYKIEEK